MDRIHEVYNIEWSGRRLTQIKQIPDLIIVRPEIWSGMSKAAQKNEKQHWTIEKPKPMTLED